MADSQEQKPDSDGVMEYISGLMQQGAQIAKDATKQAQRAVWDALGLGSADPMSLQAHKAYADATGETISGRKITPTQETPAEPAYKSGSDYKAPTPDQVAKALIMREQNRKKAVEGEQQ
jgi:hypothetical protein